MMTQQEYDVLGRQVATELLGASGLDAGTIIDAASELAKTGANLADKAKGKPGDANANKTPDVKQNTTPKKTVKESSFFAAKVGGVPVWGLLVGGAVMTTGLVMLLRRPKHRR